MIGGDGTANEAVDGITSLSDVKFGYIPTGSGNDFARGAGIPSDPLQALEAVLKGEEKEINIGTALLGSQKRRFLVSTGIGFDAGICHEALASKITNTLNRLQRGQLPDVMIALRLLFYLEPFSYLLPMALFGRHTGFPEVHMERCSSLSFQTDRAEPVHLDGESGGHRTEERIGLETERLRLLGDWVKEGMER